MDLYSQKLVGWSLKSRMIKDLVINALRMAIWRRRLSPDLIFYSDRGSQCQREPDDKQHE
ncbi:DDE-type integrase/transposase/recombinase [Desulfosediminicola sp.]|uniref:DDE-type integrase/transposase/recombinase n=1 Tax=Desulfosediminicola sp. TaxID=2886825 RepID=UPI003AF1F0A4